MKTMNDYWRRDRIAKASLARHFKRMTELEVEGMSREDASRQAYDEMTAKQRARRQISEADNG